MAKNIVRPSSGIVSQDLTFLYYPDEEGTRQAVPQMVEVDRFDADVHYPEGVIKPGILLATHTSSGETGPYIEDASSTGEETVVGMVWSGGYIKRDPIAGTVLDTEVEVAMIPITSVLHLIVAKMPGLLLADGTTANPIVAGDLPSGWFAMDAYV